MSIVKRVKINAGIGMVGGVVIILAAMGKAVILGRYLDLESFGYYVICLNAVSIIKLIMLFDDLQDALLLLLVFIF